MRVTVDTAHDSHEDLKKVIRMLQHLTGENQEIFTNEQTAAASPMANIFGDTGASPETATSPEASQETPQASQETSEASESTEDLFAELFSEEELKKMDTKNKEEEEDEEEEIKPKAKDKKYGIELY